MKSIPFLGPLKTISAILIVLTGSLAFGGWKVKISDGRELSFSAASAVANGIFDSKNTAAIRLKLNAKDVETILSSIDLFTVIQKRPEVKNTLAEFQKLQALDKSAPEKLATSDPIVRLTAFLAAYNQVEFLAQQDGSPTNVSHEGAVNEIRRQISLILDSLIPTYQSSAIQKWKSQRYLRSGSLPEPVEKIKADQMMKTFIETAAPQSEGDSTSEALEESVIKSLRNSLLAYRSMADGPSAEKPLLEVKSQIELRLQSILSSGEHFARFAELHEKSAKPSTSAEPDAPQKVPTMKLFKKAFLISLGLTTALDAVLATLGTPTTGLMATGVVVPSFMTLIIGSSLIGDAQDRLNSQRWELKDELERQKNDELRNAYIEYVKSNSSKFISDLLTKTGIACPGAVDSI
jgi:hypothetical protein